MRSFANIGRSLAIGGCLPLFAVIGAAPASAAFIESATIENSFGLAVGQEPSFVVRPGRIKETRYIGQDLPGAQSEVGVNYTAFANTSAFFFLHDNYCVGSCGTFSQTIITFTIVNDNEVAADLRFDSLITPGHIARLRGGFALGSFDFNVRQSVGGGEFATLYNANGGVNSDGIFLNTGDLQFNGLNSQSSEQGGWDVVDWSATALNIPLLTLGAGETTTLVYSAVYQVFGSNNCQSVLECSGVQVVFGDPRNNGGVNVTPFGASLDDTLYPVIGREYGPSVIPFQVVDANAPLPGQPVADGPWNYGPRFDPRVIGVPEPATWAMMIGGFALAGGAVRRRRVAGLA